MATSKFVNLTQAKEFCKRQYARTNQDTRVFLYVDNEYGDNQPHYEFMPEWDYYHGQGQLLNEQDVYACVFFGTGGYPEKPKFEVEYF